MSSSKSMRMSFDGKRNATLKRPNAKAVYKKGTVFDAIKIIQPLKGIY